MNDFIKHMYNIKKSDFELIDVDTLDDLQNMYEALKQKNNKTKQQKKHDFGARPLPPGHAPALCLRGMALRQSTSGAVNTYPPLREDKWELRFVHSHSMVMFAFSSFS